MNSSRSTRGFTLIELSIVLVIIGLIVGGVLVVRDLITAASLRAQISQIEKYQTAVNTFYGKYGGLPGDIAASTVSRLGFTYGATRAGTVGQGDGNGELNGHCCGGTTGYSWNMNGENIMFWVDLSGNSGLIEGSFTAATIGMDLTCATMAACSAYFPQAKIGGNNMVYVYSGSAGSPSIGATPNFFGLSFITVGGDNVGSSTAPLPPAPGLAVSQAYAIDIKIDDGKPTTGNISAHSLGGTGGNSVWAASAASGTSSTCFEGSGPYHYSVTQNNGRGVNCSLSFQIK